MSRAKKFVAKAKRLWEILEVPLLLGALPGTLLVWAYSNFATAGQLAEAKAQMIDAKAELHSYVDQKHAEVSGTLEDIKAELARQRSLQERILLRVSH